MKIPLKIAKLKTPLPESVASIIHAENVVDHAASVTIIKGEIIVVVGIKFPWDDQISSWFVYLFLGEQPTWLFGTVFLSEHDPAMITSDLAVLEKFEAQTPTATDDSREKDQLLIPFVEIGDSDFHIFFLKP
jgi:hypothetical protein